MVDKRLIYNSYSVGNNVFSEEKGRRYILPNIEAGLGGLIALSSNILPSYISKGFSLDRFWNEPIGEQNVIIGVLGVFIGFALYIDGLRRELRNNNPDNRAPADRVI